MSWYKACYYIQTDGVFTTLYDELQGKDAVESDWSVLDRNPDEWTLLVKEERLRIAVSKKWLLIYVREL